MGLPEITVEKSNLENKIKTDYVDKKVKLGRVIFLNDSDIRYELILVGTSIKEGQPVLDSSYLIDEKGGLEKVFDIKNRIERNKSRKASETTELSGKEQETVRQGMIDRLNSNITKWQEFEDRHNQNP